VLIMGYVVLLGGPSSVYEGGVPLIIQAGMIYGWAGPLEQIFVGAIRTCMGVSTG
jgi:hypothetical protein